MASHITQRPLILQDENFDVVSKKHGANTTTKSSKTAVKKDGNILRSRKALNDITNKSSIHHGTSTKKNLPKEEFNIAEEMCLHDHKKCIEAQQKVKETCFLDLVLPGLDPFCHSEPHELESAKTDPESPRCYPEPVELPMSEFNDWLVSSTQWVSPPSSPLLWDSPPSSPISWKIEANFVLKEDD